MSGYTAEPAPGAAAAGEVLIEKPFAPEILLARMRELLDRAQ